MTAGGRGAFRSRGTVRQQSVRGEWGAPSLERRSGTTTTATTSRACSFATVPSSTPPLRSLIVLLPVLLAGTASAFDPGLPDGLKVVHANVIMRHGERSRLPKSTALEFGDNAGVMVRVLPGGSRPRALGFG